MGVVQTRIAKGCCCCVNYGNVMDQQGHIKFQSLQGHAPECTCTQRRFVSGIDAPGPSTISAEYNDADENLDDDDIHSQRGPIPYGQSHLHPQPPQPPPSTRVRRQIVDDDEEEEEDELDAAYGFHGDFDSNEPTANNLTEQQIQNLIQEQVARLNARLNELDEELMAAEDEIEQDAERADLEKSIREKEKDPGRSGLK